MNFINFALQQYAPQPYKFGYEVKDGYGNSLHQQETGDDYNNKKGSYGYTDAYGIYRQVILKKKK